MKILSKYKYRLIRIEIEVRPVPDRSDRLVLCMGSEHGVVQLEDGVGVRLAPEVGGHQTPGGESSNLKVPNVVDMGVRKGGPKKSIE